MKIYSTSLFFIAMQIKKHAELPHIGTRMSKI